MTEGSSDLPLIQIIKAESDQGSAFYDLAVAIGFDTWTLTHFEAELRKRNCFAFFARLDQQPIAYLIASTILDQAELLQVGVLPNYRRKGIAHLLTQEFLTNAADLGISKVLLEVRAGNIAALELYSSLGFVRDGCRVRYYSNPIDDAILMSKALHVLPKNS